MINGAFVRDQSGIRIIGIMQVSVRLAALPIPEYLDFHSSYSAPRSRIAGIYSRIYSYSGIFPNERALSVIVHATGFFFSARKKSHIINPLLTKLVRSRWRDIGLVLFLRVYASRLVNNPYVFESRRSRIILFSPARDCVQSANTKQ